MYSFQKCEKCDQQEAFWKAERALAELEAQETVKPEVSKEIPKNESEEKPTVSLVKPKKQK